MKIIDKIAEKCTRYFLHGKGIDNYNLEIVNMQTIEEDGNEIFYIVNYIAKINRELIKIKTTVHNDFTVSVTVDGFGNIYHMFDFR